MKAAVVLVALAVAVGGGCKKRNREKRVTPSSTYDATAPIIDEDYRFRIAYPGKGWKLMREEDIRAITPDGLAGGMSTDSNAWGVVVVEYAPAVELEAYAHFLVDSLPLETPIVDSFERRTFAGKDAIRAQVRGVVSGVEFVYRTAIFLHQDFAYQVLSWGGSEVSSSSLDAFPQAFSLLDGPVKRRVGKNRIQNARGVGWQLTGGVFESAVTQLAVEPVEPWRVVVGVGLDQMNTSAEVGLVNELTESYIVIIPERATGADRDVIADSLVKAFAADAVRVEGDDITVTVAGQPVLLRGYRSTGQPPVEHLHGVTFFGDHVVQVLAWYMVGNRAVARDTIAKGLGGIRAIENPRWIELREALLAAGDPETALGPTVALRRGVFRDFEHGITWTKPRTRFWRARIGDDARAVDPAAVLALEDVELGIYGLLRVEPAAGASNADYHRGAIMGIAASHPPQERPVIGATALESSGSWRTEGGDFHATIVTVVRGDLAIELRLWGHVDDMIKRRTEAIVPAIDGLALGDLTVVESDRGEYRDRRLGFSIRPPASWTQSDTTPAGKQGFMSVVEWRSGASGIEVMGLDAAAAGQDEAWMVSLMEQEFRDRDGGAWVQASDDTLGGRPARRLRGSQVPTDTYIMTRNGTLYVLRLVGRAPALGGVKPSFQLLD